MPLRNAWLSNAEPRSNWKRVASPHFPTAFSNTRIAALVSSSKATIAARISRL